MKLTDKYIYLLLKDLVNVILFSCSFFKNSVLVLECFFFFQLHWNISSKEKSIQVIQYKGVFLLLGDRQPLLLEMIGKE